MFSPTYVSLSYIWLDQNWFWQYDTMYLHKWGHCIYSSGGFFVAIGACKNLFFLSTNWSVAKMY